METPNGSPDQQTARIAFKLDKPGDYSPSLGALTALSESDNIIRNSLASLNAALAAYSSSPRGRTHMAFAAAIEKHDPRAAADVRRCGLPLHLCYSASGGRGVVHGRAYHCGRRECPGCAFQVGADNVRAFRSRMLAAFDSGAKVESLILTTSSTGVTDPGVAKRQLAMLSRLLQRVYRDGLQPATYGAIYAQELGIDDDGLFRPHLHVLCFGESGIARRLAACWDRMRVQHSQVPVWIGHAEVGDPIDTKRVRSELQAGRTPRVLAYHVKVRRLRRPRDASVAAIRAFAASVPVFKGTQLIRSIGRIRGAGQGRRASAGESSMGMPRHAADSRRRANSAACAFQPHDMNPPPVPGRETSHHHESPVRAVSGEALLLKHRSSGPLWLVPGAGSAREPLPADLGLLPDIVMAARIAPDVRVRLAAATILRAAARLIADSVLATGSGPWSTYLQPSELSLLRVAGFDPAATAIGDFDDLLAPGCGDGWPHVEQGA